MKNGKLLDRTVPIPYGVEMYGPGMLRENLVTVNNKCFLGGDDIPNDGMIAPYTKKEIHSCTLTIQTVRPNPENKNRI